MKRAKATIKQENTDNGENQIGTTHQGPLFYTVNKSFQKKANHGEHQRTSSEQNA